MLEPGFHASEAHDSQEGLASKTHQPCLEEWANLIAREPEALMCSRQENALPICLTLKPHKMESL